MKTHSGCKNFPRKAKTFTPLMKAAELIEADYKLLSIFSRLGIRLGFGDISVEEMCRRYGISTELLLLICRVYSLPGYEPSCQHLDSTDLNDIMSYLHSSHVYYSHVAIPRLRGKIDALTDSLDENHRKVLARFFSDYCTEVDNHFAYEENVVFPYVHAVIENTDTGDYSIEKFEDNHSDIDEKLCDLKSIIIKYLPESCPTELRAEVLFEIFRLEEDLCKHTLIENNVLIPMVQNMENNG